MELYLVRGLPNSGKSTIAKTLAPNAHFAADDWFELQARLENISYTEAFARFRTKIALAHQYCQDNTYCAALNAEPKIAVANTFTTVREMDFYFNLATKLHYRVHVLTVERSHNGDNEHNVPNEVISKMAERWQHVDKRFR